MRRMALRVAVLAAALEGCGPPPAQVAGTYSGQKSLTVTAGANEQSSEVISISQSGGDISFTLSMCGVKATADGAASFRIADFKCSKYLASQSWELSGSGKVTANANAVTVSITGTGKNGPVESPFTWTFSGSR